MKKEFREQLAKEFLRKALDIITELGFKLTPESSGKNGLIDIDDFKFNDLTEEFEDLKLELPNLMYNQAEKKVTCIKCGWWHRAISFDKAERLITHHYLESHFRQY